MMVIPVFREEDYRTIEGTTMSPESSILDLLKIPTQGKVYDLEGVREAEMPLWDGHPAFQVMTYRTPQGVKNQGSKPFPDPNEPPISLISDLVMGTTHSGTHIDALGHTVTGHDQHWHNGKASTDLGDFGPLKGSASELPIFITRGVFFDVAKKVGHPLKGGEPFGIDAFLEMIDEEGLEVRAGDVVLFRNGAGKFWSDTAKFNEHDGGGVTLEIAQYLSEKGIRAIGGDTSTVEVQPSTVPGNPHPVHEHLLIENGIHLIENMILEELSEDGVKEFLFIGLPPKIKGATGAIFRPIALV
ncbi:cyclase family protein [Flaviflexus massiliensis]|uniref:cyclase family protein n=1 Tax=Flaviflexus massiliensis TaxID=1522309 RepID=UPI0009EBEE8C|nr:cyclase family protein [Flaviflexus massiliensis]